MDSYWDDAVAEEPEYEPKYPEVDDIVDEAADKLKEYLEKKFSKEIETLKNANEKLSEEGRKLCDWESALRVKEDRLNEKEKIIEADIAKRACRVVSYSICVSVVLFSSGMLPEIEHDRAKMDAIIRQNDGFYKKISFFDQYSCLRSERVEFIVHTFPSMYEIVKKGKGRYVVLKDRISEAKKALGIDVDEDDDLF